MSLKTRHSRVTSSDVKTIKINKLSSLRVFRFTPLTPAKRVYPKRVPRVQIPLSPPLSDRAPVAQLDRAPDYGSGGWGFKSLRARHISGTYQAGLPAMCPKCVHGKNS